MTSSPKQTNLQISDSCVPAMTPSQIRRALHSRHLSCTVRERRAPHPRRTSGALTVTRRDITPMTAMVPGESRRCSNPLKDSCLRAMTMLPMPLKLCRMAPGQQSHSDPLKSSPQTPLHHLLAMKLISTLTKFPRCPMAHLPWNQQCLHMLHPPPCPQSTPPQSSMTLEQ